MAHLDDLRRGEAIRKPVYSAETRLRTGIQLVAPARLVLVEGLFTLWWDSLRSLLDVKVVHRRTGRSPRSFAGFGGSWPIAAAASSKCCISTRARFVLAHERYVEPTRVHADDVVTNDGPLEDAVEQVIALVRRRRVDGLAGAGQH